MDYHDREKGVACRDPSLRNREEILSPSPEPRTPNPGS
jgi:hypothetical protein